MSLAIVDCWMLLEHMECWVFVALQGVGYFFLPQGCPKSCAPYRQWQPSPCQQIKIKQPCPLCSLHLLHHQVHRLLQQYPTACAYINAIQQHASNIQQHHPEAPNHIHLHLTTCNTSKMHPRAPNRICHHPSSPACNHIPTACNSIQHIQHHPTASNSSHPHPYDNISQHYMLPHH